MKKSFGKTLISLVLCVCLLSMTMITAFGAETVSITVKGGTQIAFDAATTTYNVTVPVWYESGVDTYAAPDMPTITVEADGVPVDVTMPSALPGDASFVIDGKTYTVNLSLAKNMYTNGGFESGNLGHYSNFRLDGKGSGMPTVDDTAHSGTRSAKRQHNFVNAFIVYTPGIPVLDAGKVYLSSYATRLAPEPTATGAKNDEYPLADRVETTVEGETANVTFYVDNVNYGTTENTSAGNNKLGDVMQTAEWKQLQAVIAPVTDTYHMRHFCLWEGWAGSNAETRLDDYFLGELAVGRFTLENEKNEEDTSVVSGSSAKTVVLNGVVLNQLGTVAGFDNLSFKWTADEGITVDNGVVTVPAGTPVGTYTVTASADITANNIGTISATHEINVLAPGSLADLTISGSGLSKFEFNPAVTEYTVGVPVIYSEGVDTYTFAAMPVISAIANGEGEEAVFVQPDTLPTTTTVDVMKDGEVLNTYTINFVPLGANMYVNGGVEEIGHNFIRARDNGLLTKVDEAAFTGSYSLKLPASYSLNGFKYTPQQVLSQGKTYISSYATRLAVGETPASPYRIRDFVISDKADQKAAADFYIDGRKYDSREPAQKHEYSQPSVNLSENWLQLQAVITPFTANYDVQHFYQDSGSRKAAALIDDFFLGELIIGGVKLYSEGEELPRTVSTTAAHTLTLTAQAVNQLGGTAGLDGNVTTQILSVESAPEGVSYENGVLTIPKNAAGTVNIKVKALPTAAWTTAPQESFEAIVSINLTTEAFTYMAENGKVVSTLAMYPSAPLDVVLYNAIYNNVGEEMLISVVSEDITLLKDTILCKETALTLEPGQTVKSFLWTKGTLTPLVVSGSFTK